MPVREDRPDPAPRRKPPAGRPAPPAREEAPAGPPARAAGRLSRAGRAVRPPRPRPKWLIPAAIGGAVAVVALAVLIPMLQASSRRSAAKRELDSLRRRAETAVEDLSGVAEVRTAFEAFTRTYPEPEWTTKAQEARAEFDADVRRKERAPFEDEAAGWMVGAMAEVKKHEEAGDLPAALAVEKSLPGRLADTDAVQPFRAAMERIKPRLAEQRIARFTADAAEADKLAAAKDWSGALTVLNRVLGYGDDELAGRAKKRMTELRAERAAVPGLGAILAALTWLARHQADDGSWEPGLFHLECDGGRCSGNGNSKYGVGVTALGVLAFLGAGYGGAVDEAYVDPLEHKPRSFARAAMLGLEWLRKAQSASGDFTRADSLRPMFGHILATLAQSEAARWLGDEAARESARKGVEYLLAARVPGKGWRYLPKTDKPDAAVTGWALLALWSAGQAGIAVDPAAVNEARAFLDGLTDRNYGRCGYLNVKDIGGKVVDGDLGQSRILAEYGRNTDLGNLNESYADHEALSAQAMATRMLWGMDAKDAAIELTAKALVQDLPYWDVGKKSADFYYWFFGSLALALAEGPEGLATGKYGKHWTKAATETLAKHQDAEGEGCAHGSWSELERWSHAGGRVYGAAINVLTLEILYGFERGLGRTAKK